MACALSLWLFGVRDIVIVEAAKHGLHGDVHVAFLCGCHPRRDLKVRTCELSAQSLSQYATTGAGTNIGYGGALVERGIKVTTMTYYEGAYTTFLWGILTQSWRMSAVVYVSSEVGKSISTQYLIDADGHRTYFYSHWYQSGAYYHH